MKVETYLMQGRLLDQRINYHLKKLAELRKAACHLSVPTIGRDRVQHSHSGDAPFVRALIHVEEMEEQINREIDMLVALKQQIMDVIGQVDSNELQMVLIYKYLEGKTNEEISFLLKVGTTTVSRWHEKAISQITLPEEDMIARIGK